MCNSSAAGNGVRGRSIEKLAFPAGSQSVRSDLGRGVSRTKQESQTRVPSFRVKSTRRFESISAPHFPQTSARVSLIALNPYSTTLQWQACVSFCDAVMRHGSWAVRRLPSARTRRNGNCNRRSGTRGHGCARRKYFSMGPRRCERVISTLRQYGHKRLAAAGSGFSNGGVLRRRREFKFTHSDHSSAARVHPKCRGVPAATFRMCEALVRRSKRAGRSI